MYGLRIIPQELLIKTWPLVEEYFERIVEDNPDEVTIAGIQGRILRQEEYLTTVLSEDNETIMGAFLFGFKPVDTGKRLLCVSILAGDDAALWLDDIGVHLHTIAQHENCYEVRMLGCRRGWSRLIKSVTLKSPPGQESYTLKFKVKGII